MSHLQAQSQQAPVGTYAPEVATLLAPEPQFWCRAACYEQEGEENASEMHEISLILWVWFAIL